MNQQRNQSNQNSSQQPNFELTPQLIKEFVETQKQKAINEAHELRLREKELDLNARYAEKNLDHQAGWANNQPKETRKTITRMAYIVGGIIILVLGFLTIWIYLGKDDFAYKFMQGAGYIVTTVLGYIFGSYKKKKTEAEEDDDISDADVVN